MADIELVVKIDEDEYRNIREYYEKNDTVEATYSYIYYGTPLLKGHGRLIDADAYRKEMLDSREFDFFKRLDMQPTIIEADKEESEESE